MYFSFDTACMPNVRFIGYISYKKPWIHFQRQNNEYILYLIKNGCLYIEEDGEQYTLKRGSYIILEPGKEHVGYRASSCDYFYVHFRDISMRPVLYEPGKEIVERILRERRDALTNNSLRYEERKPAYIPKYEQLSNSSVYNYILNTAIKDYNFRLEHYRELVGCRLLELFVRISRDYASAQYTRYGATNQRKYVKAQSVLEYLSREYVRKIARTEIEEEFEASYDYINRIFKELTGHSIHQYLNLIRINKAKDLIETTQMKFSDIGYLVGIDDQYYFSKIFKKYAGMTPTAYYKSIASLKIEEHNQE